MRPDQRQDGLSDMLGQSRPSVHDQGQIGVGRGLFVVWCAGFCALGWQNRRFRGQEGRVFKSSAAHSLSLCMSVLLFWYPAKG
jgi:hypothetical protein